MKTTSAEYKSLISEKSGLRYTKGKVTLNFVAPGAKDDTTPLSSFTEPLFSIDSSTLDSINERVYNLATYEDNGFVLNKNIVFPPEVSDINTGVWSDDICDASKTFISPLVFQWTLSKAYTSPGFTLYFDDDVYPTDLVLTVYDGSNQVIDTYTVTGNTQPIVTLTPGAELFRKVILSVTKMNKAETHLRLYGIDFGFNLFFTGSNLFNIEAVYEFDPLMKSIVTNQLTIEAYNDGTYDYAAIDSKSQYLQKRQSANYKHGLQLSDGSFENLNMGDYYLNSWEVSDTRIKMTYITLLFALTSSMYKKSTFDITTIGDFAEDILIDAGVTDYEIDASLYSSPAIIKYVGTVTHAEALRILAEMSGSVVYDNMNKIYFKVLNDGSLANASGEIDYSTQLQNPQNKNIDRYTGIEFTKYLATQKASAQLASQVVSITSSAVVEVALSGNLIGTPTVSLTAGFTLTHADYYANYCVLTITGTGSCTITVTGTSIEFNGSQEINYFTYRAEGENDLLYQINSSIFIEGITGSNWSTLKSWIIQQRERVHNIPLRTEVKWRQDMSFELFDLLNVQISKANLRKAVTLYKQRLVYNGVLNGYSSGCGGAS